MYNSSLIERQEFRDDIRLVEVPASEIADELGNPKAANIVMAGAYAKFSKLITYEDMAENLPKIMSSAKRKLWI